MKIYIASSWKEMCMVIHWRDLLMSYGHEVDAFCDRRCDRHIENFTESGNFDGLPDKLTEITAQKEDRIRKVFEEDKKWIDWADAVLLILPSGKSAHLEAGYAKGTGKIVVAYSNSFPLGEFEVMYGFMDLVSDSKVETLAYFNQIGREDLYSRR